MFHKGKLLIFLVSFLIVLYGASAAFFGKEAYKELSVFMKVLDRVRDEYVEVPDMNEVQEGAMRGMMDALDPYCGFLTRQQYEDLERRRALGTAGAGVVLSRKSDVVYVVSLDPEGPAARAGMHRGDYVIAIDGEGVEHKSLLEVDSLLSGAPGTRVTITLFRDSRTKPRDLEFALEAPPESPVGSRMLDGGVGYLKIASLRDQAVEQARVKLKTLISAGAGKIVLDLRGCADGSAANGATVANYFLSDGVIYYSRNREGEKVLVVEADPEKTITLLPAAVLINGSTAGAAEIIAGALKDGRRATVVGERSFGLGSEQKTIPLKSGALLVLSTAKYCTPGGTIIQDDGARKTGIEPDLESPDSERRQDLAVESYYDEDDDGKYQRLQEKVEQIQLEKALEILLGENIPAKIAA
ncbi:MAG: PDZ domain-containing protein [Acidobacteria bacterium]|nr:PDZ domain-containing protein [Acidobacteriota bacterium]